MVHSESGRSRHDVFLSYSGADYDVVLPLVERLRRDSYRVWFDKNEMLGGRPVATQIAEAIVNSTHMIACLSDTYVAGKWTISELNQSVHLDPSGREGRTIPVVVRRMTKDLPETIEYLTRFDLTDESTYADRYDQIVASVTRDAPLFAGDVQNLANECEAAARGLLEDPIVALFRIRRATAALSRLLYQREVGELPSDLTLSQIVERLLLSRKLPPEVNSALATARTFSDFSVNDRTDTFEITHDSLADPRSALLALTEWAFPERTPRDPWTDVMEALTEAGGGGRRLPGTDYALTGVELGRNGHGPLHPGRDVLRNEPVTVNLVKLPKDQQDDFLDEGTRFSRLSDAHIVAPVAVVPVEVNGHLLCWGVIFPAVDGLSGQELIERNGPLPPRAAYELCLGIASALRGFHGERPPIAHGDVQPVNVLVDAFGSVRVLCVGSAPTSTREEHDSLLPTDPHGHGLGGPPTIAGDLFALRRVLHYLLTGRRTQHAEPLPTLDLAIDPGRVIERLERCTTAAQAGVVLNTARRGEPDSDALVAVSRLYYKDSGPVVDRMVSGSVLVDSCPVESRSAWPLGDGLLLVWDRSTETLAVLDGPNLLWRDSRSVAVRKAVTGPGGLLAVGGWDGQVRCFRPDGSPQAVGRVDGAVGDLTFVGDMLVVGSWKGTLCRFTPDGVREELLAVGGGVHRIAPVDSGNRFTIVDLAGRLAVYVDRRRVSQFPGLRGVRDIAYAGSRLVVLTDDGITGVGVDGVPGPVEPMPDALRLLPSGEPGRCLLIKEGEEVWKVDEAERHIRVDEFPERHVLLDTCAVPGTYVLSGPSGGCVLWRRGREPAVWPDAHAATLSADGRLVAVSLPGQVKLYGDLG